VKTGGGNTIDLALAAREARQRSSTALYLIASAFLATAVMRANDLRHDVVALIAAPAYAATAPADGSKQEGHGAQDGHGMQTGQSMKDGHGTQDAPGAMPAADGTMAPAPHGAMAPATDAPTGGPTEGQAGCLDGAFLAAAREREQELATMGVALDGRKRELEVTEKRVAMQLTELARQQDALQATFGQAETAAEKEAMQLVSIYEQMKPKQASLIFDQMPAAIAAGFIRRMRKTSSALIMANMDPKKAFEISLLLAGRSSAIRHE